MSGTLDKLTKARVKQEARAVGVLTIAQIPNFLTISRFILTFVVGYLIVIESSLKSILSVFIIAAFTDFLDGKLARRFKWESEFGRKADIIADRFLWVGTSLALAVSFGLRDMLTIKHGVQLLLIMTRELVAAPFVLIAFFAGNPLPHARFIGKLTTFIQGFALPALIISVFYDWFYYISLPLAILSSVVGFVSALHYLHDIHVPERKVQKK